MTGTLDFYDQNADAYADIMHSIEDSQPLRMFIERAPHGAHVLDLGCGPGWAAAAMQAAGLTVRATDGSAEMVKLARDRGVDAHVAMFDDLSEADAYDAIWASFSLLHAPRAEMDGNLQRIATALKPGGFVYMGLKVGEDEATDRLGRFYAYFTVDEMRDRLARVGLTIDAVDERVEQGMAGTMDPVMHLFAHG